VYSFIETKLFTRLIDDLLSDDALAELQGFLMETLRPAMWSRARGACASFAGPCADAGSEADYG
jgi:hypothetical protein